MSGCEWQAKLCLKMSRVEYLCLVAEAKVFYQKVVRTYGYVCVVLLSFAVCGVVSTLQHQWHNHPKKWSPTFMCHTVLPQGGVVTSALQTIPDISWLCMKRSKSAFFSLATHRPFRSQSSHCATAVTLQFGRWTSALDHSILSGVVDMSIYRTTQEYFGIQPHFIRCTDFRRLVVFPVVTPPPLPNATWY